MKVIRSSDFGGDRYKYDCGECAYKNGFAQVDTRQDASYYGTWANPYTLIVVNYCEGDVSHIVCADTAEFVAYLGVDLLSFAPEAKIDPGFGEEMKAEFIKLGLGYMLH